MCYYCLLMLQRGMSFNYTYTLPIVGTVNGVLTSLSQITVIRDLLAALGNSNTTGLSITSGTGRQMGLQAETRVDGMEVCRYHIGVDRKIG